MRIKKGKKLKNNLSRKSVLKLFVFTLIILSSFGLYKIFASDLIGNENQSNKFDTDKKIIIDKNISLKLEDEGAKVPLSKIVDGCLKKDCIPSIDDPIFESVSDADKWIKDDYRVFILEHNDIVKIYPQNIMGWHEIVNDWFGDEAIAVTFCPLCGTATAFNREIEGVITEFGVSGKLHNSDLIMYDRYQGSLWQQVTGEAISGPAARKNLSLNSIFLITLDWQDAAKEFPSARVLSRDTGHKRDYDVYFYEDYTNSDQLGFGATNDSRLSPKDWIYGIEIDGFSKAYKESDLKDVSVIKDMVGETIILAKNQNGVVSFFNLSTNEEIVAIRSFWFAWAAFNPDTEIYQNN